jgi:imidazoleglycerol-phosphate dehydratase/histidinol-phosphatase
VLKTFENEGVHFSNVVVDRTWPADNAPTRKPGTALLTQYFDTEKYDLKNSYTIGDRKNDVLLGRNLGAKAIWLNNHSNLGGKEFEDQNFEIDLKDTIALQTTDWQADL